MRMKILLMLVMVSGTQLKVAPGRVKRQSYGGLTGGGGGYGNNYGGGNSYGGGRAYGGGAGARANVDGCQLMPMGAGDPLTPARQGQVIDIQCQTDTEYDTCIFTHTKPFDVGQSSYNEDRSLKCSTSQDSGSSSQCHDDTRISMVNSNQMCGIRISNPEPDDMGVWKVVVSELRNGNLVNTQKDITVYTYNQSIAVLQTKRDEEEIGSQYDVKYNYDDWRDKWMDGESGYERHEIECNAMYGSPTPEITWSINRQKIADNTNVFRMMDGKGLTHDPSGLVYDWVSELSFEVNREFLTYLDQTHNIDVNPQSGEFTFDLECNADQGNNGEYHSEITTTRVRVTRVYDSDELTKSEIGIIVGSTFGALAVLLILATVALMIFAKSTGRWCFTDDNDYRYQDPQDKRRVPTHAQVHSDEDSVKKQPKVNPNYQSSTNSSNKSKGSSTKKKIFPSDQNPPKIEETNKPKVINYDLQVQGPGTASDSGLSSPASPASSLDKHEASLRPTPLSEAKPRTPRPKSQFVPKHTNDNNLSRLSYHGGYDNLVVGDTQHQVYTVTDIHPQPGDGVTYAELDSRYFMVPENKVLPTTQGATQASSHHSGSAYAEISSKPIHV